MKKNIFKLLTLVIFINFINTVNAQIGNNPLGCFNPDPLTFLVSNVTPNSFTFSWAHIDDPVNYHLELKQNGILIEQTYTDNTYFTSTTILSPNTQYQVFIQHNDSNCNYILQNVTTAQCSTLQINPINISSIGTNSCSFTWGTIQPKVEYEWKIDDSNGNTVQNGNTSTTSVTVAPTLTPDTDFTLSIRGKYKNCNFGNWETATFKTASNTSVSFCPTVKRSVVITNQQDVINFLNDPMFLGCTNINADITINTNGNFVSFANTMPAPYSLASFSKIESIKGNLFIENFKWNNNPFSGLKNVDGSISLSKLNSSNTLLSMSLFDQLTTVGNIKILENLYPIDIKDEFKYLKFISNDLYITDNSCYLELPNFDALVKIEGNLNIDKNPLLQGIPSTKFPLLNKVVGNVDISQNIKNLPNPNPIPQEISGFNELQEIGGFLQFLEGGNSLQKITGFQKLTTIKKHLSIQNNYVLTDISGLSSITSVGNITPYNLFIYNNGNLSDCSIQSLCLLLNQTTTKPYISGNSMGCNSASEIISFCTVYNTKLNAKVFIGEVDISQTAPMIYSDWMSYDPNNPGVWVGFPLVDPYSKAPLSQVFQRVKSKVVKMANYPSQPNNIQDKIVDWVFIELRSGISGSTIVESTRSALVQKDGDVVDIDGFSPVEFKYTPPGDYFVSIRHRNHLGARTLNKINFTNTTIPFVNFTDNSIPLYGSYPVNNILDSLGQSTSYFGLNGADANSDGSVDAFDTILWEQQMGGFTNYSENADYNLDGSIDAFDTILWEISSGKFQELD